MKFNKYLICALFLVLICCIGAASAADAGDDVAAANDTIDEAVSEAADVSDEIDEDSLGVSEEPALSEGGNEETTPDEITIYVGQNTTDDGGNGSYENPFSTFEKACNVSNGHNKVDIMVFDGIYNIYYGELYNFNVSNLKIEGLGNNVIINAPWMGTATIDAAGFKVNVDYANVTINNIYFNSSSDQQGFSPLRASSTVNCEYNNCTFSNIRFLNTGTECYPVKYINCSFENITNCFSNTPAGSIVIINASFEYCKFSNIGKLISYYFVYKSTLEPLTSLVFNGVWFGSNEIPSYFSLDRTQYKYIETPNKNTKATNIFPQKYAIFSANEYYLGNNRYEIIGKLTWNGTDDQEGMENFQPMTVKLSSTTGEINQTATLVNGNFRAVYTSSNINHKVTATLDDEEIELNFNNTDIVLDAPAIKYGEDQNITITFQQPINSTITITINNNKTYGVKVNESNSINFTIKDLVLTEGDYNISVSLIDEVNHIYGSNSTILSVSKYDTYIFVPEIVDTGDIKVGDNVTVKLVLPEDVSGNITVYINNNPVSTKDALKNNEINVTGLVAGDNTILVTYNGNDKYASKSTEPQIVTVYKVSAYDFDVVVPTGVKVGEDTNITIKLPGDVSGNALVYIGNQDSITVPISGESTIVPVSGLVAGNNTVKVVFSDDKYAEKTLIKNITVEKLPVEITNNTIVVNAPTDSATPTVSIDIPGATGNLTVIINNKTFTAKLENGTATVTIKDVPAGTYNATVIYSGDDTFNQITTTASITVSEPKKQDNNNNGGQTNKVTKTATKIVAKKKTFKAKKKVKKYTITLKAGKKPVKKVWVTLKIKGKKLLKAKTNAKGKATFKIKKLTKKGKYNAVIKFKGNKNYKASSKKVKITIKK